MYLKRSLTLLSLLAIMLIAVSCTEEKNLLGVEEELNKVSGTICNSSGVGVEGATVSLKVANYNPIAVNAINYDAERCRGLRENPEVLELEVTTDNKGCYSFPDVPAGIYTLTAKDKNNSNAAYKPNIKIADCDTIIGTDTLQGYVEITIHVPDSYVSENSYFYIPGTDIFFSISKAGTMYIQVPVGMLSLVFMQDSELFLETLFLIIKNLMVGGDTTVIDTHEIYKPYVSTIDSGFVYSATDTILFGAYAYSSEGHPLQYRFTWEDSSLSEWSYAEFTPRTISTPGYHNIFVQVRCGIDTTVVSDWSDPFQIKISDTIIGPEKWISAPKLLYGSWTAIVGEYHNYTAANAYSNVTSEFEYQFNWGDGTYSNWLSDTLLFGGFDSLAIDCVWDTSLVNGVVGFNSWEKAGSYMVTVRARSAFDSLLVSEWSWDTIMVNVNDSMPYYIPAPDMWGPSKLKVNEKGNFTIYHPGTNDTMLMECVIDWGDGTYFNWTGVIPDSVAYNLKHAYKRNGVYSISARVGSAYDSLITSKWSYPLQVIVSDSGSVIIPRPLAPYGDSVVMVNEKNYYYAGPMDTTIVDTIQYRFDWGDSLSFSEWTEAPYSSYKWSNPGFYSIRCQARSMNDTTVLSEWSYPFWIQVLDTIINDTLIVDTLIVDTLIVDTLIVDTLIGDTLIGDTLIGDTLIGDTLIGDTLIGDTLIGIDTTFNDTNIFIDTTYILKK